MGIGLLCCGAVLVQGCAKKVAVTKPPAPPAVTASAPARPEAPRPTATPQTTPTPTPSANRASGPDQATKDRIQALLDRIQDAYFDYNADTIRKDAQTSLYNDSVALSEILRQYPNYKLTIEGYCDERGSGEYNLALGDKRAKSAKQYLINCGVAGDQIKTVSLGKEQQVCSDHNETCWQKNRRIHITQG
jgi:peptidoglycan-associated lipoprotein